MRKRNVAAVMDTVIGEHTTFTGKIESEGSIKVEGRVDGDIKAGGDITILANAVVVGNIWCKNIILSGTVTGNIHAKGTLHLESTSRLKGDVEIHSLVTDEGSTFEGNCKMTEPTADTDDKKKKWDFKRSEPTKSVVEEKEG
ncbi:MAG: polymer-forming cytoskeletal protein [Clostridiaceae bacterium]|jgi:cytoskeletal protein CcmA (bactofilin family)|nr:polymer-forming cytoskeletal protein [Clostridiaceae bacterium]